MSCREVDRASTAMASEAAVMSKPVCLGTPSAAAPRPTTMLRSARSLTSSTRFQVMLCWSMPSLLPWCRWLSSIAESMLCAAVTACMSPVRCRFSVSNGTTWLYPPPAAPPLIPNVGPIEACLSAIVARLPMCRIAWPRPTVVVVLPSPSGVGVIAVSTMYFALGSSSSSSIADSLIFTTCSPYGSSRCMPRPTSLAMSSTGFRCAPRAISRSLGNAMPGLLDSRGFESVDFNGELGARGEQGVEQVLAGGSLAVQEVVTGAAKVVADYVGSQRGDRGPERCAVRRNAVRQLDSADLGKHAGPGRSVKPDQCPAVGEIDPGDGLGGGLRGGLLQHRLQRA